ncbi:hypothetical protein DPMN_021381 [Dreissena polymorpha]|uniref:Uncharacterized protein n=1 Tax=Dreissena polymorpha TaxID=45954 RepID=A0A9D4S9X1_DREPO|nr:hypothetical protein DPMN_021381 [Dreissena polymorpha]
MLLLAADVQVKSAGLPLGDHRVVLEVVDHCFQTGTATLTITVVDDVSEHSCFVKYGDSPQSMYMSSQYLTK